MSADQPDIFDAVNKLTETSYGGLPPYTKGSDTSKAAAVQMLPNVGTIRYEVWQLFIARGAHGLIDREIEGALGLRPSTVSARRRELEMGGLVRKTDAQRDTGSGRMAHVYVAEQW